MRVVIAEDQVLLREGLARLFEDGGHEVVASLPDAEHLPAAVAGHRPDLVVLDVRMPPTFTDEGARAAKQIKEQHPELGVLVLSQHVETAQGSRDLGHHTAHLGHVGEVATHQDGVFQIRRLGRLAVPVGGDAAAGRGERAGGSGAYSTAGPGDQDALALEPEIDRHHPSPIGPDCPAGPTVLPSAGRSATVAKG